MKEPLSLIKNHIYLLPKTVTTLAVVPPLGSSYFKFKPLRVHPPCNLEWCVCVGGGWGEGVGWGRSRKKLFRPFGPQFDLKLRAPQAHPLDAPLVRVDELPRTQRVQSDS